MWKKRGFFIFVPRCSLGKRKAYSRRPHLLVDGGALLGYPAYERDERKQSMPSTVVSLRVSEGQAKRLQRKARRMGRSPSETGAILLEESLRREDFAFIDFRDSPVGRQAYIQASRLSVWMVVKIARIYGGSVKKTADHLQRPLPQIQAALNYAREFPQEIESAIQDNDSYDVARISRMLPQARLFEVFARKPRQE